MKIQFTQQFQEVCLNEYHIAPKDVQSAIQTPDNHQILDFDGLVIGLFVKQDARQDVLLICARRDNEIWLVDLGFKVHPTLTTNVQSSNPIELLRWLVDQFGLVIQIGEQQSKLFFREAIICQGQPPQEWSKIVGINNPSQNSFALSMYCRMEPKADCFLVNCALVFCIDTEEYSRWLFGWGPQPQTQPVQIHQAENVPQSFLERCSLTDKEKTSIYQLAQELHPDDSLGQHELAQFRGACIMLNKIFGSEWYKANIEPSEGREKTFLRLSLEDDLERHQHLILIVELAEAIYSLRNINGIADRIDLKRKDSLTSSTIESLWFEFWVPYLIQQDGNEIIEFVREDKTKRTPDLIIKYREHILPIEIKVKLDSTPYSRRALVKPLEEAFDQLPSGGPGAVFLMLPTHWLGNKDFLRQAEGIIESSLLRNRNCNAIYVMWPLMEKTPHEQFIHQWRFRHFITNHPKLSIARINELLCPKDLPSEPTKVSFL